MKDSEKESRSKLTLGSVERKEKQPRERSGYVSSEKSSAKKIKQIRTTLKARIIPNLPLEPKYLRKNIEDIIDKFEFEWYFKEMLKEVFADIEKIDFRISNAVIRLELINLKKRWLKLKNRLGKHSTVSRREL